MTRNLQPHSIYRSTGKSVVHEIRALTAVERPFFGEIWGKTRTEVTVS